MKSFKENWPWYRRRLTVLILLVYLVFGLHGLYTYYAPRIEKPLQLLSAVLYGMMSLFLFNSPLSAEANVTWTYEVAKWLAPMLTSALLIRTLVNGFRHALNAFFNRWGRYVVVFGLNDPSDALLKSLKASKEGYKAALVTAQGLENEEKGRFERMGVAAYTADFVNDVKKENESSSQVIGLDRAYALVLAEADDLKNYNLFMSLLGVLRPKQRLLCHLRISSDALKGYLNEALEAATEKTPELRFLDLHFYNHESLAVSLLLQNGNLLEQNLNGLSGRLPETEALSAQGISQALGTPRLLVFGLNELTENLILRAANDLVINLEEKIKICLVDPKASARLEAFLSWNEMLQEAIAFETVDADINTLSFNEKLNALAQVESQPTCILLLKEAPLENLELFSRLDALFPGLPVMFRNVTGVDLKPLVAGSARRLTLFGNMKEIMTPELVLQEKLDEAAIAFNARYNQTASAAGSFAGADWDKLSPVKKRSSRESAAHVGVKEKILLALSPKGSDRKALQEKLKAGTAHLNKLQKETKGEEFRQALLAYLEEDPAINYLTQLEHKRWCNAYYAMNFRQGSQRDEKKRTHPCLIEDWEVLTDEAFFSCHPEYDLISVFALFGAKTADKK